MSEEDTMEKYNTDEQFAASFDKTHAVVHGIATKDFKEADMISGKEQNKECKRKYGAWTISEPLDKIRTMRFPKPY